jgi:hypothetical protein
MNETIDLSVTPHCKVCGGAGIDIPDNPTDDSIITCPSCRAMLGTYGEFKAHLERDAVGAVEGMIEKAFEGLSHITLKK